MSETIEQSDETGRKVEQARRDVAVAANRVATVGAHAARMALLREPEAALPWVAELRDAAYGLREALEDLRDLKAEQG